MWKGVHTGRLRSCSFELEDADDQFRFQPTLQLRVEVLARAALLVIERACGQCRTEHMPALQVSKMVVAEADSYATSGIFVGTVGILLIILLSIAVAVYGPIKRIHSYVRCGYDQRTVIYRERRRIIPGRIIRLFSVLPLGAADPVEAKCKKIKFLSYSDVIYMLRP